jgi:hypothetical protein
MTATSKPTKGQRPPRTTVLRIGNASGYWGDDAYALRRQLLGPERLDYITMDFLAELSMSILQKQRSRDATAGWARDFLSQVRPLLPDLKNRGTRLVTNAGGVNPRGCADALLAAAREIGITLRVAVVLGDDILDRVPEMIESGLDLKSMETGEPIGPVAEHLVAANVYFGAGAVVRALEYDPDIVICGRVTDTGITLGPMIHELGWKETDYDLLAAGIIAGHIVECGAQATGGNFTDYCKVPSFFDIGYPILECNGDGSFVVTKHSGSGGLVSVATVSEQLVYEMGDPHEYLTPDCVADFSTVRLAADGLDRVRVSGIRGGPPPRSLKVSAAYSDGFKVAGSLIVSGPDAREKAQIFARICWSRLDAELSRAGLELPEERLAELVGDEPGHAPSTSLRRQPGNVLLRLSLRGHDRIGLEIFRKLVPSLILSGPPGVAVAGGAPATSEVIGFWPCLIPREAALPCVEVWEQRPDMASPELIGESGPLPWPAVSDTAAPRRAPEPGPRTPTTSWPGPTIRVPLMAIAHARSGDKGDTANIGVIARSQECYDWMQQHLSASRVRKWFTGIALGEVNRHEVPSLRALNFLLDEALGGGGTRTLKLDAQGKTLSQMLLRCTVTIPETLLATIRPEDGPCPGELTPIGGRRGEP